MPVRQIKGAAGDLYDNNSKAHHLAMHQLCDFLRDIIGFVVVRVCDEKTLRVYPRKIGQYPLLNPWFDRGDSGEFECLGFAVSSKGDRRTLHKYLKTFDHDDTVFSPDDFDLQSKPKKLLCHGHFVIPLRFKAKDIDFRALSNPLCDLLQFLKKTPRSK